MLISYTQTFFIQAGLSNAFLITSVNPLCFVSNQKNSKLTFIIIILFRIIVSVVGTIVLILAVPLIDRVGRRRLLLIGAIGMSVCEFIVAIVGVTAGNINPVTLAVNTTAQKVLVVFVMLFVFFHLSNFVIMDAYFFFRFLFLSLPLSPYSYICFFSASWGPVVWVITGEIFVSFSSAHLNQPFTFFFAASRHPS